MLLSAASSLGVGGVTIATVSAISADSLNALGVFLGGLAALVSAIVALVALLRRKDPAEIFAEGVKYGRETDVDEPADEITPRRRRRRQ